MKAKLTPKQKLFCYYYTGSCMFNATKAAKLAGYSKKTADVIGCQNLAKVNVKEKISELSEKLLNQIKDDHPKLMQSIDTLAHFNLKDLYDEDGNLRDISELPDDLAFSIAGTKTILKKDGEEWDTITEIKTIDKLKAIEMKAKILKLYEDHITGNVELTIRLVD